MPKSKKTKKEKKRRTQKRYSPTNLEAPVSPQLIPQAPPFLTALQKLPTKLWNHFFGKLSLYSNNELGIANQANKGLMSIVHSMRMMDAVFYENNILPAQDCHLIETAALINVRNGPTPLEGYGQIVYIPDASVAKLCSDDDIQKVADLAFNSKMGNLRAGWFQKTFGVRTIQGHPDEGTIK